MTNRSSTSWKDNVCICPAWAERGRDSAACDDLGQGGLGRSDGIAQAPTVLIDLTAGRGCGDAGAPSVARRAAAWAAGQRAARVQHENTARASRPRRPLPRHRCARRAPPNPRTTRCASGGPCGPPSAPPRPSGSSVVRRPFRAAISAASPFGLVGSSARPDRGRFFLPFHLRVDDAVGGRDEWVNPDSRNMARAGAFSRAWRIPSACLTPSSCRPHRWPASP